jgi:hypothetical protein
MKPIQPVSIWYNGIMITATIYNLTSISDDLSTYANFYWQLFNVDEIQIAQGNLTMSEPDYTNYSTSPDSNEYAYQWGATQLNITLV